MGAFNDQAKELEKMLDDADKALKDKISEFDASGKPEEPKAFSVLVSSYDQSAIEKVRAFATELGCGVR